LNGLIRDSDCAAHLDVRDAPPINPSPQALD